MRGAIIRLKMKGECIRRFDISSQVIFAFSLTVSTAKCTLNTHKEDSICNYFVWRDDLRVANPLKYKPCNAATCKKPKARASHRMCVRGFCKECCIEAAKLAGGSCKAPNHRIPTIAPGLAESGSVSTPSSAGTALFPARPYGRMLSPLYAQKLAQITSPNTELDLRAKYRKENAVSIRVLWWTEVRRLKDDESEDILINS